MDFKDIKVKTTKDLKKILAKTQEELRELRFKVSQGALKQVRNIRSKRKDVARILTVINKKEVVINK